MEKLLKFQLFFSFFNSLITAWKTFCLFNLWSNIHCRSRETTSPFSTDHDRKFFTPKNLCVTCMCVESTDQPQKGFHCARFLLLNYLHCTHQPTFNNHQLHHQPVGRFPIICWTSKRISSTAKKHTLFSAALAQNPTNGAIFLTRLPWRRRKFCEWCGSKNHYHPKTIHHQPTLLFSKTSRMLTSKVLYKTLSLFSLWTERTHDQQTRRTSNRGRILRWNEKSSFRRISTN